MMIPKIGAALIVIAVLIAGIYYFWLDAPVDDIDDPGVPQATILMEITKIDPITSQAEATAEFEFEIKDNDDLPTVINPISVPMTTIEVGIPFVEPDTFYQVEWFITASVTPQHPDVTAVDTTIWISGNTPDGVVNDSNFPTGKGYYANILIPPYTTVENIIGNMPVDTETLFEFTGNEKRVGRVVPQQGSNADATLIRGSYLHNSEFNITINSVATQFPAIFGTTSIDVILKVGEGGTLTIDITDVSAVTPAP